MWGLGGGSSGIGVQLKQTAEGVAVAGLAPGGPASKSGQVRVNDLIEQVSGVRAGKTADEVAEKLKGAEGSEVELRLVRQGIFGKETVTAKLRRATIEHKKPPAKASPPAVPPRPTSNKDLSPALPSLFGPASSNPPSAKSIATPPTSLGGLFGGGTASATPQNREEKNAFDLFGAGASPQKKPQNAQDKKTPPANPAGAASPAAFDIFGGMNAFIKDAHSLAVGKGSVGVACAASEHGVVIKGLQPGGSAAKSGKVSVSDVIVEVDGKPCAKTVDEVEEKRIIKKTKIGLF
jgi:hypothetical protein